MASSISRVSLSESRMTMIALRQEKKLWKKRDLEGGSLIPWEEAKAKLGLLS
jgi:hypothetical protein